MEPSTNDSANAEVQVDQQDTEQVTPESTDTTVNDGTQETQGLTDVTPEKGNNTTPGFIKGLEKKNLKLKEKDSELLETHAELAKVSAEHRVKLSNEKPEIALKVAKKLGYEGIKDFLDEIETEKPVSPPISDLETGRSAFITSNKHLLFKPDGSKSELNIFLGKKQDELLAHDNVTSNVYLKFMNDAKDHFLEKKKANKTFDEILQSSQKVGTPKSGAVPIPTNEDKPSYTKEEKRFLDAMGAKT